MKTILRRNKLIAFIAIVLVGMLVMESCGGNKSGYGSKQKSKSKNDRIKRNTKFMTY